MFSKAKPPLTINIPNPCHQNWQQMTPAEHGRFCQACQTVVTDFTNLSDDDIIKRIEQASGAKLCGRFLNTQTNRVLLQEKKAYRISTFRKAAASVLLFYASVNELVAQVPAVKPNTYSNSNTTKPATKITGITISGKVIDFTGQGLPRLELQIAGTDSIRTTDAYGRFKFRLPENFAGREVTISATVNGQILLDSTGSFINDINVMIDTFPFKKQLTIYRYPIEVLNEAWSVCSVTPTTTGIIEAQPPVLTYTGIVDMQVMPALSKKKSVWQKFKQLFKR